MSWSSNLSSNEIIFNEGSGKFNNSWNLEEVSEYVHMGLVLSQNDIIMLLLNVLDPFRVDLRN